jgi:hypothetical protein
MKTLLEFKEEVKALFPDAEFRFTTPDVGDRLFRNFKAVGNNGITVVYEGGRGPELYKLNFDSQDLDYLDEKAIAEALAEGWDARSAVTVTSGYESTLRDAVKAYNNARKRVLEISE